jgi:TorA maturation chaperone TorD
LNQNNGEGMDEMNDRELFRVRLLFLDLVKSFFVAEPDAENLSRWRGTFSSLTKEQVSPRFDNAVAEISRALNKKSLKDLQDEFYKLFTDPFDGCALEMTASFYLNGKSYSQALVDVRGLMDDGQIKKDDAISEPEDSLVVMLDTFASLVEEERVSGGEKPKELQGRLLTEFLEPFTEKFSAVLKENEHADFYYLCCRVLEGYLDLEKGLIVSS